MYENIYFQTKASYQGMKLVFAKGHEKLRKGKRALFLDVKLTYPLHQVSNSFAQKFKASIRL